MTLNHKNNSEPLIADDDPKPTQNYHLEDADDYNGLVPEDALQTVNPALAEKLTPDHDPHGVVKGRPHEVDAPLVNPPNK